MDLLSLRVYESYDECIVQWIGYPSCEKRFCKNYGIKNKT